jgi:hypothetical protein
MYVQLTGKFVMRRKAMRVAGLSKEKPFCVG